MPQFYRIDGRRLSYREYRRLAPNLVVFLIAAVLKLLGGGLRFTGLVPRLERLHEVSWDGLPDEAREALAGPVSEWERLGFRRVFVHEIPTPQQSRFGAVVVLAAPSGEVLVQLGRFVRPDGRFVWTQVCSRFADDTWGLTTDQKLELDDPPFCRRSQQPDGLTPIDFWDRHRENLDGLWADLGPPQRLTEARAREFVLEMEQAEFDYHADRGVFIPVVDEDELEELADRG